VTSKLAESSPSRRFHFDASRPVFVLLALLLAILVVFPLFLLLYYAFIDGEGRATLSNFATLVSDPTVRRAFGIAILMALGVGALATAVATPMAWLVTRTDVPGRGIIRALVLASFVTPPFLGAVAWEILAAPNSGILNDLYRWATGSDGALLNIYTFRGLVFAIACYTFPYVFTLVANALDRIPSDLEDASAILGATWSVTLRKITFPLVLPAMLAGSLIALLQALTLFGSPAILALPAGFHVITTKIWSYFQFPPQLGLAAASAIPLLLITILLLRGQRWILGRKGYAVLGGKGAAARTTHLGKMRWPATGLVGFVLCLTVIFPYAALMKAAFTRNISEPLSFASVTLENFNFVFFEFSATRLAMWNTFLLGILSATAVTALVLIISYVVIRRSFKGASALGVLATTPIAIPGIVLGVGLFLSYANPTFMLYGTLWILLIAFVTLGLPAGYQQMSSAMSSVHADLEDASRIFGATRLKTLWTITTPLLRTSIIATWCFVFIATIRELSATILLTTANTKLVSVIIYDLNESGDLGAISVLGIMLLTVSFFVVFLANKVPLMSSNRLPLRG
jgi:iron(III) transport system permease protein